MAQSLNFSSSHSSNCYPHLYHRNPNPRSSLALFGPLHPTGACTSTVLVHRKSFSMQLRPVMARFNSFPPHSSSKHQHLSQDWISGASEESTPSIMNGSSSSPSRSPSLSPAGVCRTLSPTRLRPPEVDIEGNSDSPIHNLSYLNLVNRYVCLFYKVTYLDVDVLHRVGT